MKMSTFLYLRTLLPFAVVACLFGSFFLYNLLKGSFLSYASLFPAMFGAALLLWFFAKYGYCPKCNRHLGKNIGKHCKHCGYEFSKTDIVAKRSS